MNLGLYRVNFYFFLPERHEQEKYTHAFNKWTKDGWKKKNNHNFRFLFFLWGLRDSFPRLKLLRVHNLLDIYLCVTISIVCDARGDRTPTKFKRFLIYTNVVFFFLFLSLSRFWFFVQSAIITPTGTSWREMWRKRSDYLQLKEKGMLNWVD